MIRKMKKAYYVLLSKVLEVSNPKKAIAKVVTQSRSGQQPGDVTFESRRNVQPSWWYIPIQTRL